MYWLPAPVALVPLGVVTVTYTLPAEPDGTVAVIVVSLVVMKTLGFAPKLTPVASVRFVPVMVTVPLPDVGPEAGEMDDTVGAARVTLMVTVMESPDAPYQSTVFVPVNPGVGGV